MFKTIISSLLICILGFTSISASNIEHNNTLETYYCTLGKSSHNYVINYNNITNNFQSNFDLHMSNLKTTSIQSCPNITNIITNELNNFVQELKKECPYFIESITHDNFTNIEELLLKCTRLPIYAYNTITSIINDIITNCSHIFEDILNIYTKIINTIISYDKEIKIEKKILLKIVNIYNKTNITNL
jgi:hypothetical protein